MKNDLNQDQAQQYFKCKNHCILKLYILQYTAIAKRIHVNISVIPAVDFTKS